MPPHRILVWHWGRRGGGPRYTLELARALAARGDLDVHLSYSRQAEIRAEFDSLGLPSLPVDTYSGSVQAALSTLRLPWLRRRFAHYIRSRGIATVIGTMNHLWDVAVAPVIRPAGARFLFVLHDATFHPGEENGFRAWSLGREVAQADTVVTLSTHVRDAMVRVFGYPAERSRIIPHGVFVFGPAGVRTLPEQEPLRLLFFGRILPYKGLDLLLGAYGLLRERWGSRVTLTIAGAGDLSPYTALLAALPDITLDHRWIGEDEVASVLGRADLMVLPYREASQSGVAACAYGAGMPLVATPVGGLTEQVRHGETGIVAADVTAPALAAAITRFLEEPGLYGSMSRAALGYAERELSWRAVAAGFADTIAALPPLPAGPVR